MWKNKENIESHVFNNIFLKNNKPSTGKQSTVLSRVEQRFHFFSAANNE